MKNAYFSSLIGLNEPKMVGNPILQWLYTNECPLVMTENSLIGYFFHFDVVTLRKNPYLSSLIGL